MLVAAGCQVVNADIPVRDLWQVVLGSAAITQQLSTVVAAVSVPVYLRLGLLDGHSLLLINIVLLTRGANDWHCWKHQWWCATAECSPAATGSHACRIVLAVGRPSRQLQQTTATATCRDCQSLPHTKLLPLV